MIDIILTLPLRERSWPDARLPEPRRSSASFSASVLEGAQATLTGAVREVAESGRRPSALKIGLVFERFGFWFFPNFVFSELL